MAAHQWMTLRVGEDGSESRGCPVCGLIDERRTEMDLDCIEPVPALVTYDAIRAELKAHPVDVFSDFGGRHRVSFEGRVHCRGIPDAWVVGLTKDDGYLFMFRSLRVIEGIPIVWPSAVSRLNCFKSVEEGFAELLRAMRVRLYNPYTHSDFAYAERMARHRHHEGCED